MVESISNYTFENIIHTNVDEINTQSLILWIIHANKIPPHIGISFKAKFYSLKANGKDNGVSIKSISNIIVQKKITTVLVELNGSVIKENIETCFDRFEKTIPFKITCLQPIKKALGYEKAEKLIDLLILLELNNDIIRVNGINTDEFKGIIDYDVKAIHSRLVNLKNAE